MSDYRISEEDIDAVVRYMELFHPENANREYSLALLEHIKSGLHQVARNNPEDIEAMYAQYESSLNKESED